MSSTSSSVGVVAGQAGRRRAPVGEHGDAVADAPDLVEAVRDVDDADALGREPANDVEERLDLALVEDRGRLVHDQQPDVARQRAGDRHDLLRGRPQRPHLRAQRDRRRGPSRASSAADSRYILSRSSSGPRRGSWPRKMLSATRQVLDEVELLVDRRDAALERRRRVAGRQRLAHEEDLAAGRLDRAGDALDQRRLAGAVGPEQAVHLGLERRRGRRPGAP